MKTKFILLCTFIIALSLQFAKAQTSTGNLKVIIDLSNDVLQISLAKTTDVTFLYNLPATFSSAQTQSVPGQLKVTSNKAYTVQVAAASTHTNFKGMDVANSDIIDLASLEITATDALLGTPGTGVNLSTTPKTILTGIAPGIDKLVKIDYKIADATTFISKKLDKYETQIVYSVTTP